MIKYSLWALGIIFWYLVITMFITGNFYKLDKGVYRAGQMYRYNLPYYLKKHNIKTVINLTLASDKDPDYINETEILNRLNIKSINHKMQSGKYVPPSESKHIINILKNAEKPILIHCFGGADRTSLVSALYAHAIMGQSAEIAKTQLSAIYGHLPSLRPHVLAMDNSFIDYIQASNHEDSMDKDRP